METLSKNSENVIDIWETAHFIINNFAGKSCEWTTTRRVSASCSPQSRCLTLVLLLFYGSAANFSHTFAQNNAFLCQKIDAVKENFEFLRLVNVFSEDSFVYRVLRDEAPQLDA